MHLMFDKTATAKKDGDIYGGANVWFYKKEGADLYVLFQKRAQNVHNGGFYDSSSGGHLEEGEAPLSAALRETKEEIGVSLSPNDLDFLCSYIVRDKLCFMYLSDRTNKNDAFTLDPEEVDSLEWVSLADFEDFWQKNVKPCLRDDWLHHEVLKHQLEKLA